jgi:hypothetical protein
MVAFNWVITTPEALGRSQVIRKEFGCVDSLRRAGRSHSASPNGKMALGSKIKPRPVFDYVNGCDWFRAPRLRVLVAAALTAPRMLPPPHVPNVRALFR